MSDKDEFANREQLGDLPPGLTDEMLYMRSTRVDAVGDLMFQAEIQARPSASGTIPFSGDTVAVFDSRFINGLDFNYTQYLTWNITAPPPAPLQLQTTYNVPGGYRCVLRGFRWEMDPVVPITYAQLTCNITVNGIAQLGYNNLILGQILNIYVPVFILADDAAAITFTWNAPTGIASVPGDVRNLVFELYGNLIQDTGAPLALEIANKEVGLPVKVYQEKTPARGAERLRHYSGRPLNRFRFFKR